MNTTSELRSFPPAEDLITFLSQIDYKGIADRIITIGMYAFAIFVVLGSKLLNALHRFWEVNGETITIKANRAVDYAYISAAVVYNTGKNVGERYYSFRDLIRATAN